MAAFPTHARPGCYRRRCVSQVFSAAVAAAVFFFLSPLPVLSAVPPPLRLIEPDPQTFRLVARDPRFVSATVGVRVPMYAPSARWRVLRAATPEAFLAALRAEEAAAASAGATSAGAASAGAVAAGAPSPFDLVFPLRMAGGVSSDTGATVRIDALGEWSCAGEAFDIFEEPASAVLSFGGLSPLSSVAQSDTAFAWVGFSRFQGEVWFGCSDMSLPRARPLRASELSALLAPHRLDFVATVAATGPGGASVRWRGRWLGAPAGWTPPVTEALCLRIAAVPPEKANDLLRDERVSIRVRNASPEGDFTRPLRDGRTRATPALDTFWWARARRLAEPVEIEFDLMAERKVERLEIRHASAAGFSRDFDLGAWELQTRANGSSPWRTVGQAPTAAPGGVSVLRFDPPVRSRAWRLLIPPSQLCGTDGSPRILRIAEVCLWAAGDTPQ